MCNKIQFITSFEIWAVGLSVAASFFSERFLVIAVGSILLFTLLRWVAYRKLSVRTPADIPIIILILMLPVTLQVTGSMMVTFPQVLRVFTGIGFYYATINWTNTANRLHWMVRGVWSAGCLLALYAIISVQWNSTKLQIIPMDLYAHFKVQVGDPINPNVMAGALVLLLPVALGLLFFYGSHMQWFDLGLSCLTVFIGIAVLLLTQSRGGILALLETFVLITAMRWRRGWWLFAGVGILVGVFIVILGPASIVDGILANASLGGLDGRIEVWSRSIYMIQDFPFTGVGMGSFDRVTSLLYPFFQYAPGTTPHAHNLFFQIAIDLGIPGLVAWLSIWLLMSLAAWQIYYRGRMTLNLWASGLGAGFLCSQIALATHGMLDATTWGMVKPAPLVWLIWGMITACWFISGNKK